MNTQVHINSVLLLALLQSAAGNTTYPSICRYHGWSIATLYTHVPSLKDLEAILPS